jgi:Reverse transcriptase (RNA-dependent DNA polymerase)
VQVRHSEGVAIHTDPESCAGCREAASEALIGARTGEVLSGESNAVRGADAVVACRRQQGFRPGRGQHDALDALAYGIYARKINWILDADISRFFDSLSPKWLIRFLEHRIGDRRIIRLIQKRLRAGVLEDGRLIETTEGTPWARRFAPGELGLSLVEFAEGVPANPRPGQVAEAGRHWLLRIPCSADE